MLNRISAGILEEDITIYPTDQNLDHIVFHLINFCDFDGQVVLNTSDWQIRIECVNNFSDLKQKLFDLGGYAITHIGKIEKSDKSLFTPKEVQEILEALHFFFSFAKGSWSSPVLPIGFNSTGNKIWESWDMPNVDFWRYTRSWFNKNGQSLTDLFPGFWDVWQNNELQKSIRLAIHWYIETCKQSVTIEGSIALQQVALEMLSWVRLVDNENKFNEKEFYDLTAYCKIENLLEDLGISKTIPSNFSTILPPNIGLVSGPHIITWLRNKVIHGDKKNRDKILEELSTEIKTETWQLGKRYLELVLLRLFNYKGYLLNWTKKNEYGNVAEELVPWPVTS